MRLWLFILAYNLGNFMRPDLSGPKAIKHWSLRSLRVKLIEIGEGWCATPGGWSSTRPRWPCRECCFRECWIA